MDWSLTQALKHTLGGLKEVLVLYDIACQYFRKFTTRVNDNPFLHIPHDLKIWHAIGLWHIHGHKALCFPRFSPTFIPGIGWVDGEILETLWSALNLVSGSTRAMTAAHRSEVLDDHMNNNNWKKLVRMGNDLQTIER